MKINTKLIRKEILKNNDWVNGRYDYRDGDVMAMANAEDEFGNITVVKDETDLFNLLVKWDNGNYLFENLVFIKHWNYGTFVYYIDDLKNYVEHLSIHLMSITSFNEIIDMLQDRKRKEEEEVKQS